MEKLKLKMKKNPFVDHCLGLDQLPKGMGLTNCLDPDPDFRLDLDPYTTNTEAKH